MHHRGSFTSIAAPLSLHTVDVCGFAYVDDTDLISMVPTNCAEAARDRMQTVVDDWEAVSKTTGGALVPSKCWAWVIEFDWTADKWKYLDTSKVTNLGMTIKNELGETESMKMLSPSDA